MSLHLLIDIAQVGQVLLLHLFLVLVSVSMENGAADWVNSLEM